MSERKKKVKMSSAITGPIAPYNNVPIAPQYYQPSVFVITALTLGITTIVTTNISHNYVIGQQIRLTIPPTNGCRQLNEASGYVVSIPSSTQVEINIDSTGSQPFVTSSATTKPQIMAIGDVNTGQINSNGIRSTLTYIPGSFTNISPL